MFYCELLSWNMDRYRYLMNDDFLKDNNITIKSYCNYLIFKKKRYKKIRLPFSIIRDSNTDINLLKNNKTKIMYIKKK